LRYRSGTLTSSGTELTTAATDAALALVCLAILAWWLRRPSMFRARKAVWASVFALLTVGSALGAVAHGFEWSETARAIWWRPLYLSLGWSVAMFVVGALGDWRGAGAARAAVPWAIAAGLALFVVTQLSDDFTLFIAYEGVAMVATLLIYLHLAVGRGMPGARRVAAGVALTLVAAMVQASSLRLELVWTFDHNSLFHLVQIPALAAIANGLGAGAGVERRSRL
jgi:hypothetical protein